VTTLRIAVVGAGYMGTLHAEKLAALQRDDPGLRLAAVMDVLPKRARSLGRRLGAPAYGQLSEILHRIDAAIVAVPTVAHYEVVRPLLAAGVDVLVEKPIAANLVEAEALLALAQHSGRVLQVGHLEWFNNAMKVVREHISRPRFIEAHRLGPFPDRATDIDVVRDLMIHDLDIVQQLLGAEPVRIEAIGIPVLTSSFDIANARVTYPDGCVANLTASRVSTTPMRKIRFFQRDGYFSVDFLEQSALVVRRVSGEDGEAPQIRLDKIELDRGDALMAQLRAFVAALRTRERPRVDGASGLGALRTALRVSAAIPPLEDPA
jgi:predicted dehydrogenase